MIFPEINDILGNLGSFLLGQIIHNSCYMWLQSITLSFALQMGQINTIMPHCGMNQNIEWSGKIRYECIWFLILPRYEAVHRRREIVGWITEMDLHVMMIIGTHKLIGEHRHHTIRADTEDDNWGWRYETLKSQCKYVNSILKLLESQRTSLQCL